MDCLPPLEWNPIENNNMFKESFGKQRMMKLESLVQFHTGL